MRLPPTILTVVLQYCDGVTLARSQRVGRLWYVLARHDGLWHHLCVAYGMEVTPTATVPFQTFFAQQWGAAITTTAPNDSHFPSSSTHMCTNRLLRDHISTITSHFYAAAPYLTSSSRYTLARRHMEAVEQHIDRLRSDWRGSLQGKLAALRCGADALVQSNMDGQSLVVESQGIADTLRNHRGSDSRSNASGYYVRLLRHFERTVLLRDVYRVAGKNNNKALGKDSNDTAASRGTMVLPCTFLDMELEALQRPPRHQWCGDDVVLQRWKMFVAEFPIDDTYYDLVDKTTGPTAIPLDGNGSAAMPPPHCGGAGLTPAERRLLHKIEMYTR